MKINKFLRKVRKSDGYVALEFSVAMGLLVLPTALILLQIPTYLERSNRLDSVASITSKQCANMAERPSDGDLIANETVLSELRVNSTMNQVNVVSARCVFDDPGLEPGTNVRAEITVDMPGAVVPGADFGSRWTMTSTHTSVIPKYRSFVEVP